MYLWHIGLCVSTHVLLADAQTGQNKLRSFQLRLLETGLEVVGLEHVVWGGERKAWDGHLKYNVCLEKVWKWFGSARSADSYTLYTIYISHKFFVFLLKYKKVKHIPLRNFTFVLNYKYEIFMLIHQYIYIVKQGHVIGRETILTYLRAFKLPCTSTSWWTRPLKSVWLKGCRGAPPTGWSCRCQSKCREPT